MPPETGAGGAAAAAEASGTAAAPNFVDPSLVAAAASPAGAPTVVGAAPDEALPNIRDGAAVTRRPARPSVVSPIASGRLSASRDVPRMATKRRQPPDRRRTASRSVSV